MANPFSHDATHWEAALEFYHLDLLNEAFSEVQDYGVGEAGGFLRWYRVIEAEAATRCKSIVRELTPWLSFEYVPDELLNLGTELSVSVLQACDEVADRLGWRHGPLTRLAILAEETDAPWSANPYGYCVTKDLFEKICLPNYLVDDDDEFRQAVAHEYAHVISVNLSDGYAPRWLEETVSVLAERKFDPEATSAFRSGEERWLSPQELELTIENPREEDGRDVVWLAYQQAGLIGRYLLSLGEERKLGDLLREHANESPSRNLRLAITGRDRTDGAMQATYGMNTKQIFRNTLEWLGRFPEMPASPR